MGLVGGQIGDEQADVPYRGIVGVRRWKGRCGVS